MREIECIPYDKEHLLHSKKIHTCMWYNTVVCNSIYKTIVKQYYTTTIKKQIIYQRFIILCVFDAYMFAAGKNFVKQND